MKMRDALSEIQTKLECNHFKKPGEPCDLDSGGWWTCSCAVIADKKVSEYQRSLSFTNGDR